MKTKHYIILAICLFLAAGALTNPDTEKHKEKVKLKMNEFYEKEMVKDDRLETDQLTKSGRSMGMLLGKSMINMMADNMVTSSNYILFSTTNVTWEGKTKSIGIGAFGNVFLSNEIDEALKK
ncbi:MAG: DUF4359 domain-containing protein [Flavobacterium sp.]